MGTDSFTAGSSHIVEARCVECGDVVAVVDFDFVAGVQRLLPCGCHAAIRFRGGWVNRKDTIRAALKSLLYEEDYDVLADGVRCPFCDIAAVLRGESGGTQ